MESQNWGRPYRFPAPRRRRRRWQYFFPTLGYTGSNAGDRHSIRSVRIRVCVRRAFIPKQIHLDEGYLRFYARSGRIEFDDSTRILYSRLSAERGDQSTYTLLLLFPFNSDTDADDETSGFNSDNGLRDVRRSSLRRARGGTTNKTWPEIGRFRFKWRYVKR